MSFEIKHTFRGRYRISNEMNTTTRLSQLYRFYINDVFMSGENDIRAQSMIILQQKTLQNRVVISLMIGTKH